MPGFPEANILEIDLSKHSCKNYTLQGDIYRLYPGGSSLGLYLAVNNIKPGVHPLSPENTMVFSVSPLTGLPISGTSRMNVTAKSPVTGGIGDSQAGGFFPTHLKANGLDAIVICGRSEKPCYIFIDGDSTQIIDAEEIWGKVTGDSEKLIRRQLGRDDVEIAQIGPGGENKVVFASIINMCNRANGRNGMGAVMGSKNLKAIVVARKKPNKPENINALNELSKEAAIRLKENIAVKELGLYGTASDLDNLSIEGFLPTRNWSTGYFSEGASEITGKVMAETILKDRDTCYACSVRCKRVVEVPGVVDPVYGGPEYETIASFGSYCGIKSLEHISLANQLCNMYGLDTISCGAVIAFAMEAYQKGLITREDTGGIEIKFGDHSLLEPLITDIAYRRGFGEKLALGSYGYASELGEAAISLTATVKRQDLPAHMPQYKPSLGLIYAVNPFGADHQSSEHDTVLILPDDSMERKRLSIIGIEKGCDQVDHMDEDRVRFAWETQKFYSLMDTLCLCQFVWGPSWELYGPDDLINLCKSGIRWETTISELLQVGERRINMMRAFNAREGFTKKDDRLPEKIFVPLKGGPSEGVVLNKKEHETAKEAYYKMAGWDADTGNPTATTLERLSLTWVKGEPLEITVRINGETQSISEGTTVNRLLEELGRKSSVAVFINGTKLNEAQYSQQIINEGDFIRIVKPLLGG